MPDGTVQALGRSRNDKPTVTIDGQLYYSGDTDIRDMKIGDRISFQSNSSNYRGQTNWFLNAWKPLQGAQRAPLPSQPTAPIAAPTPNSTGQGGITEAERILAYGVVTEAIKAGLIKEPTQVEIWLCAAKNALRSQGE